MKRADLLAKLVLPFTPVSCAWCFVKECRAFQGAGLKQVREMSQCNVKLSQTLSELFCMKGMSRAKRELRMPSASQLTRDKGCAARNWVCCFSLELETLPVSPRAAAGQEPDSQGNRRCDIGGPTVEHIASAVHASRTWRSTFVGGTFSFWGVALLRLPPCEPCSGPGPKGLLLLHAHIQMRRYMHIRIHRHTHTHHIYICHMHLEFHFRVRSLRPFRYTDAYAVRTHTRLRLQI